jgi:transposase
LAFPETPLKMNIKKTPSKLAPYKDFICEKLQEEPDRNAQLLLEDIHRMGYSGGKTVFYDFTHKVKKEINAKIVVRYETNPGLQAQVDWKEVGRRKTQDGTKKLYAFVMTMGYSRRSFITLTTHMDSHTLLWCHIRAFQYFGALPKEILYDNMKTAFYCDPNGQWRINKLLLAFSNHYGFIPKRCRVRRPQTKGKVERKIGFFATNCLPRIVWPEHTIDSANELIQKWLKRIDQRTLSDFNQTRMERFSEDVEHMLVLPDEDFDYRKTEQRTVSYESMVVWNAVRYSVPPEYIGKEVTVKYDVGQKLLSIYYQNKCIQEHIVQIKNKCRVVWNDADKKEVYRLHRKLLDARKNHISHKRKALLEITTGKPSDYDVYAEAG